ncbi:MAG: hypothetical protein LBG68_03275 [Coriobacteriales bacterium]|nr:hypothetical protein [Coriobacteriales bacterium]
MLTTNSTGGRRLASVLLAAAVAFSLFVAAFQPAYAVDTIFTGDKSGSRETVDDWGDYNWSGDWSGDKASVSSDWWLLACMETGSTSPVVTVEPSPSHPVPAGISITLVQITGQDIQSSTGSASNTGSNDDDTSNKPATDEGENAAEPEKEDSPFNSLLWIALCLLVIGVLAVAKTSFITRRRR